MRIATFNCNSVRARMPILTDWIEANAPDVLALQETKVVDEDFPREPFEALGYAVAFRGQKSYNGVALLSKPPLKDVNAGLDDGGEPDEARLIRATVSGVVIVNTYVPQGREPDSPQFRYKLEWLRRLRDYFDRHFTRRRRIVWVGDFNVAPEPIDVYDSKRILGHVCHCPAVFEALAEVRDWGFVDVFRMHKPEPGLYSFFDYRLPRAVERDMGWRVDHVYATRAMAKKSVDAWIDLDPRRREKPSDHTPVVAEFDA